MRLMNIIREFIRRQLNYVVADSIYYIAHQSSSDKKDDISGAHSGYTTFYTILAANVLPFVRGNSFMM